MVIIGDKNIKEFTGVVVSDSMEKSRVVVVETVKTHPLYKKRYVERKKYYVHDEQNQSKKGNLVVIRETRPISKLKRWMLVNIVE